jgi:subtilisin family serine protease
MDDDMRRLAAALAAVAVLFGATQPALATPGPPNAPEYWFDSWRIQSLWDSGVQGQGVTIAEVDTGVNAALPELSGRVLRGVDLGNEGGIGHVDREIDTFGHGTAMASIMVARPGLLDITGIAPQAKVLPIAVPLNGTTNQGESDQVPSAIRYAANHGAKIISLSLGGKRSPKLDSQPCNDEEQAAIFHALRKGAVVVASVGNTGPTRNTVEDPAVCLGVVSVGAVDVSGTVASFSGRQPYLTMVAPGVDVPSLGRVAGQAFSGDGTSQATALTSAALALVWSKYPKLTGREVVTRMLATLDAHRSRPSNDYGYGLLDAYRAVTADVPSNARNPVYDAAQPFLARESALKAAAPQRPARVRTTPVDLGTYAVGSSPRLTPQVITGAVLGAAGLLLLLVLLVFGIRGRRRRKARAAEARAAALLAAAPAAATVPDGWMLPIQPGPNQPLTQPWPTPEFGPAGGSGGSAGDPPSA